MIALKVRPNFLQKLGIIMMEKNHNLVRGQNLVNKIKNGHNVVLIPLIPHKNLLGTRNQWNKKVPNSIGKNKINLIFRIDLHT